MTQTKTARKRQLNEAPIPFEYQILEDDSGGTFKVQGVFQRADKKNRNGRIYPVSLWQNVLNDPSIQERLSNRRMVGEIDHPVDGKSSLRRASHVVTNLYLDKDTKQVIGEAEIFDNEEGKHLRSLFRAGVQPGISSRGNGQVSENGVVKEESYDLVSFDFVANPSTHGAFPGVVTESDGQTHLEDTETAEELLRCRTPILEHETTDFDHAPPSKARKVRQKLYEAEARVAEYKNDERFGELARSIEEELRTFRESIPKPHTRSNDTSSQSSSPQRSTFPSSSSRPNNGRKRKKEKRSRADLPPPSATRRAQRLKRKRKFSESVEAPRLGGLSMDQKRLIEENRELKNELDRLREAQAQKKSRETESVRKKYEASISVINEMRSRLGEIVEEKKTMGKKLKAAEKLIDEYRRRLASSPEDITEYAEAAESLVEELVKALREKAQKYDAAENLLEAALERKDAAEQIINEMIKQINESKVSNHIDSLLSGFADERKAQIRPMLEDCDSIEAVDEQFERIRALLGESVSHGRSDNNISEDTPVANVGVGEAKGDLSEGALIAEHLLQKSGAE